MRSASQATTGETASDQFSRVGAAILRTLAYSDIFDYPLTAEEIRLALPVEAAVADVEAELATPPLSALARSSASYYFLAGREQIVATRQRRGVSSEQLRRRAGRWGSIIGNLPFVRMVAMTGSLAVDNAEADEDVDYLIVTKPGRVWTARALTIAIVRLARLARIEICPNYFLAEDALALPERDAYVARELVQMNPVSGEEVARRMLEENAWWRDYLPNAPSPARNTTPQHGHWRRLKDSGEALLSGRIGDAIEKAVFRRKGGELRRLAGDSTEAVFDESMCKGHVDGHRQRIQQALSQRLQILGLEER